MSTHQDWGRALGFLCPPNHFNTPWTYCILICFFTESCVCDDYTWGFNLIARSPSSRTDECGVAIHVKSALMRLLIEFYMTCKLGPGGACRAAAGPGPPVRECGWLRLGGVLAMGPPAAAHAHHLGGARLSELPALPPAWAAAPHATQGTSERSKNTKTPLGETLSSLQGFAMTQRSKKYEEIPL